MIFLLYGGPPLGSIVPSSGELITTRLYMAGPAADLELLDLMEEQDEAGWEPSRGEQRLTGDERSEMCAVSQATVGSGL